MELLAKKVHYSNLQCKRAETKISKKKSTKINVGMDGWKHLLAKYTNKKSTFHNIATFHTTILIYMLETVTC